jgi:hypothetical protein
MTSFCISLALHTFIVEKQETAMKNTTIKHLIFWFMGTFSFLLILLKKQGMVLARSPRFSPSVLEGVQTFEKRYHLKSYQKVNRQWVAGGRKKKGDS